MTQSELLSMWERGEGQRPSRRALALLSAAGDEDAFASLPVGRRDAALLALRARLFGRDFDGVTACPACGDEIEMTFDEDEVRRIADVDAGPLVCADGFEVTVRAPRTEDLAAVEGMTDLEDARAVLLARCIGEATVEGRSIDASALPAEVVSAVIARLETLDPQADVTIQLTCPSCAHAWREPFDIAAFFWTEVSAAARRLLSEVHELALAYGWSEQEILRLSPARRNAYLEMVQ